MNCWEALSSPEAPAVINAVITEEVRAAFGAGVLEAAELPPRPRDGSALDALLSPEVLGRIRGEARAEVSKRKKAIEGVRDMRRRRAAADKPASLAVLEAVAPGGARRFSRDAHAFLERRQGIIDGAALPDRRTRAARVLEALSEPQAVEGDELVADPATGRVVEAAVAAVPPERRGWREALRAERLSGRRLLRTKPTLLTPQRATEPKDSIHGWAVHAFDRPNDLSIAAPNYTLVAYDELRNPYAVQLPATTRRA